MNNSRLAAVQTLDWLVAPIEQESFIQVHLNRKPLRVSRRSPSYYDGLLNENSLEYALFVAAKVPGAVEELIGEENPRRCRNYQAAIEAYKKGKSLRIDAIQRFSRELILFCRALEQDFSCPVNINMYLTPSGMQALSRHYDTHDVFVLQIHGKKRWRIFDSPVVLPLEYIPPLRCEPRDKIKSFRLERHKDMSAKETCKIVDEFVLDRGDLLYLPRGFWHEAEAVAGHISCHLTTGIQSFTYADLLAVAIAQVAAVHPELRESLPFGFGTHSHSRDVIQQHARRIVQSLPERMDSVTALNELAEAFVRSRQQFGASLLRMVDVQLGNEVEVHSHIVVREGLLCRVTVNGDCVALSFGPLTISLPIAFEPAFRFIASNRQFYAHDLPGQITDEERVSLIRRLVIEGALLTSPNGETGELASDPDSLRGWLPIQLAFRDHKATLKWLHFDDQSLREPFFTQSVKRLRQTAGAQIRTTNLSALSNLPDSVQPSGFVFHISRCGSTLVSNAMRAAEGTIVISEPQPIGEALAKSDAEDGIEPDSANSKTNEILKGLVRAYGQIRSGDELALVIKFSSWNILHLAAVRKIWPGVPVIIIIRHPLEIMASCLEQPPGWMRLKRTPSAASRRFEWDEATIASMTDEQFCAKGIGRFLSVACRNVGPQCRIVDYADLNADTLLDIGNFFGISGLARGAIEQTLLTYSKDASGKKMFVDDRRQKQALVTDLMRREFDNWARAEYESLRNQQFVLPMRLAANPVSQR